MSASSSPIRMPCARQRHRQVDRDGRFADAALAGGHRDDRLHVRQQQRRLLPVAVPVAMRRGRRPARLRPAPAPCARSAPRWRWSRPAAAPAAPRPRGAPAPSPRRAPGRSAAPPAPGRRAPRCPRPARRSRYPCRRRDPRSRAAPRAAPSDVGMRVRHLLANLPPPVDKQAAVMPPVDRIWRMAADPPTPCRGTRSQRHRNCPSMSWNNGGPSPWGTGRWLRRQRPWRQRPAAAADPGAAAAGPAVRSADGPAAGRGPAARPRPADRPAAGLHPLAASAAAVPARRGSPAGAAWR